MLDVEAVHSKIRLCRKMSKLLMYIFEPFVANSLYYSKFIEYSQTVFMSFGVSLQIFFMCAQAFCLILPYFLWEAFPQWPSIALNKPIQLFILKLKTLPNHRGFFWYTVCLFYILIFLSHMPIKKAVGLWSHPNISQVQYYQLSISINLIGSIISYIIVGILLTFLVLYYKAYISRQMQSHEKT